MCISQYLPPLNSELSLYLSHQSLPIVSAAAALYAAARHSKVAFPDDAQGRPWWEQLDVRLDGFNDPLDSRREVSHDSQD